jgi:hypothetical protein
MTEDQLEVLDTVSGHFQAEIIRGMLEAQDIRVALSQEGAGSVIAVNVGPLGEVQILVQSSQLERAKKVLDDYYSGAAENQASSGE